MKVNRFYMLGKLKLDSSLSNVLKQETALGQEADPQSSREEFPRPVELLARIQSSRDAVFLNCDNCWGGIFSDAFESMRSFMECQ